MNDGNLIKPKRDQTPEQRRAAASKAGKAAAKKRREKKELQEIAKTVLHMPFEGTDAELDELEGMSFEEYPDRRLTVSEISVLKVAKKPCAATSPHCSSCATPPARSRSRRSRWPLTCPAPARRSAG